MKKLILILFLAASHLAIGQTIPNKQPVNSQMFTNTSDTTQHWMAPGAPYLPFRFPSWQQMVASVNAEKTARQTATNTLSARINADSARNVATNTALANEAVYRYTGDNNLSSRITGDSARLNTERSARQTGDNNLSSRITNDSTRTITNANNLANEITRAMAAEALKVATSSVGVANGVAGLDANGKVPLSQINDALIGSVNYQGSYNASTNSPALPTAASGNKGYYWIVSTAGTQQGLTLNVGDWIISNGASGYSKIDNNNAVTSVNGSTGAVTLTTTNIAEGTNQYFTNARALAAPLTGFTSGAGTVSATSTILQALQIHDYNSSPSTIRGLFSGTVNQVNYNNSTGVFSLPQSIATTSNVSFGNITASGTVSTIQNVNGQAIFNITNTNSGNNAQSRFTFNTDGGGLAVIFRTSTAYSGTFGPANTFNIYDSNDINFYPNAGTGGGITFRNSNIITTGNATAARFVTSGGTTSQLVDGTGALQTIPSQYWSRSGTTLSPATAGDNINVGFATLTSAAISNVYAYNSVYFGYNGTSANPATGVTNLHPPTLTTGSYDLYLPNGGGTIARTVDTKGAYTPVTTSTATIPANFYNYVNLSYSALSTVTLQNSAAAGDIIEITVQTGTGKLAQNAGDKIVGAYNTTTGTGGYLSLSTGSAIRLRCVVANTGSGGTWAVVSTTGTISAT